MAQPARKTPPPKPAPAKPAPRADDSALLRAYDERKAHPEPTVSHEEVKRLLGL